MRHVCESVFLQTLMPIKSAILECLYYFGGLSDQCNLWISLLYVWFTFVVELSIPTQSKDLGGHAETHNDRATSNARWLNKKIVAVAMPLRDNNFA